MLVTSDVEAAEALPLGGLDSICTAFLEAEAEAPEAAQNPAASTSLIVTLNSSQWIKIQKNCTY